ncbi:MAG: hypothetical protein JXA53_09125 [Bacteroidales bacterium]|nr:hypothetical protein [Bacteroidales bacterium]
MGFIKNYSYLRALLVGVPFGLFCLVSGINMFIDLPKNEKDLNLVSGKIVKYELKFARKTDRFIITLDNKKEYYSENGKDRALLVKYFAKRNLIGAEAVVWKDSDPDYNMYIEQLKVNNEMVIKFNPTFWVAHFFLWLGVITLASALIYVIKHPEDLTGKKKK